MLNVIKRTKLISLIVIANILIYFRAGATILDPDLIFGECARNSGRISAGINLILLFLIGHFRLKEIYKKVKIKKVFYLLIISFPINHIIHLLFVYLYFKDQHNQLNVIHNIHGAITFLSIVLLPMIFMWYKKLNKGVYIYVVLHFLNVAYFMIDTFYSRVKPVDPAYLHQVGILIMISCSFYMVYRLFIDVRE